MFWLSFAESDGEAEPPTQQARPDADEQQEEAEVGELVTTLVPWLISILLHVGVVLLTVFIVWSTVKDVEEEKVVVPDANLSETPGAPLQQTETERQTQSKSQSQARSTSESLASSASNSSSSSLSSSSDSQSQLIGAAGGGGGGGGATSFSGAAAGAGDFKAKFFGTGGNAERLVYMVDASGSLIDVMPFVIRELKSSVGDLSDKQELTVIFFQGDDYIEVPPPGMKEASSSYKKRVMDWVSVDADNIVPMGLSNPVTALERALKYRPELMFLLSDNITGQGRYEVDQTQLLKDIRNANEGGTKINTIQFVYDDPLTKYGLPRTLERISEQTGGEFNFIDARELGLK